MKDFLLPLVPAVALGMILTLTACQMTATNADQNDWVCEAFRPIYWSPNDTSETLNQIAKHNAAWGNVCISTALTRN